MAITLASEWISKIYSTTQKYYAKFHLQEKTGSRWENNAVYDTVVQAGNCLKIFINWISLKSGSLTPSTTLKGSLKQITEVMF